MNDLFKKISSLALGCLSLLTVSCQSHYLNVQTQYLSRQNLASFHINSPDPALERPLIGQRLMISWSVPKNFCYLDHLTLKLKVRLKDYQEEEIKVSIQQRVGTYFYDVVQDKFEYTGGILTYKADLLNENCLIYSWTHPLWTDLITFQAVDEDKK